MTKYRTNLPDTLIDKTQLTAEELAKVNRALSPRDTPFSLRFSNKDIQNWRDAAKEAGETITAWVEKTLNKAAKETSNGT